jgi:hypothetical protein
MVEIQTKLDYAQAIADWFLERKMAILTAATSKMH